MYVLCNGTIRDYYGSTTVGDTYDCTKPSQSFNLFLLFPIGFELGIHLLSVQVTRRAYDQTVTAGNPANC
jgi:hypothetical protein